MASLSDYLVSLQVAHVLGDRGLHGGEVLPEFGVLLAEVVLLLQQGGVAAGQTRLVHPQHCQLPGCLGRVPANLLRVLLQGVQPMLVNGRRHI